VWATLTITLLQQRKSSVVALSNTTVTAILCRPAVQHHPRKRGAGRQMIAGDGMHVMRCCCAVLLEGACLQGCMSVLLSQCLRGSRLVAAQDREDVRVCACVCGRGRGGGRVGRALASIMADDESKADFQLKRQTEGLVR
jgi:hypothetical protein